MLVMQIHNVTQASSLPRDYLSHISLVRTYKTSAKQAQVSCEQIFSIPELRLHLLYMCEYSSLLQSMN